jgi:hypothetical protein
MRIKQERALQHEKVLMQQNVAAKAAAKEAATGTRGGEIEIAVNIPQQGLTKTTNLPLLSTSPLQHLS